MATKHLIIRTFSREKSDLASAVDDEMARVLRRFRQSGVAARWSSLVYKLVNRWEEDYDDVLRFRLLEILRADYLPKDSRSESARHKALKRSGLEWLRSQGFADAAEERFDIGHGPADVASGTARITVECGATAPEDPRRRQPLLDRAGAAVLGAARGA